MVIRKVLTVMWKRTTQIVNAASDIVQSYPIETPMGCNPYYGSSVHRESWIDFVCHPPCPSTPFTITSPLTTNIFLTFAQELRPIWDVPTVLSLLLNLQGVALPPSCVYWTGCNPPTRFVRVIQSWNMKHIAIFSYAKWRWVENKRNSNL